VSAPPRRRLGPVWLQAIALAAVTAGVAVLPYAARSGGTESPQALALTVLPFSTRQADAALGAGLANAIAARLGGQQLLSIRHGRRDQQRGRWDDVPGGRDRCERC